MTVQIPSALLWEIDGEPHREDLILAYRGSEGSPAGLVVLGPEGRERATRPDDLPEGSVLLVPPRVSDEELSTIERLGYKVRRSTLMMLGPDIPVSEFIRAVAEALPFFVIRGKGAFNLIAELGGPQEALEWLVALANDLDRPVGINLPTEEGTTTGVIAPSTWSQERLQGWTAGYKDELEGFFGEIRRIEAPARDTMGSSTESQPSAAPTRKTAVAAAERELDDVMSRLASELRRRRPELFDAEGRLRPHQYSRAALRVTRGKRMLTRDEILRLGKRQTKAEGQPSADDGA
jgi:hypothetical protein